MKKILLGTTVLVGAAALSSAAFAAETPKVTIGGFSDFQVGVTSEDLDANRRAGAFRTDNVITFRVDGKTDAGLGYGAGVDLHADVSDDTDSAKDDNGTARRTFTYLDGQWGRLQMGADLGVSSTMKVDASRIARATGGVDGDFTYFLTDPGTTAGGGTTYAANAGTNRFIATPDLVLDYGAGGYGDRSTENLNKISYYTPRFAGVQAGVSYLFDNSSRGQTVDRADNGTARSVENIWQGGLNWEGKFDQVGINLGATGEWGNSENATNNDLRTWNVGAKAAYMGFSLAGSYGSWGDSLRIKTTASDDDTNYWTVGAAYETGPFGASVTYLDSTFDLGSTENQFSNLSVGVDYKLAAGLTPYAEVNFIKVDSAEAASTNDNDATVFIAGTQLAF